MEHKTRFELAIDKEAKNVASVYGISELTAKIIMLKGATIYQDDIMSRK